MKKLTLFLLLLLPFTAFSQVHKGFTSKELRAKERTVFNTFGKYPTMFAEFMPQSERKVRLERVSCSEGRVNLYFNEGIIHIAIREELCKRWEDSVRMTLGEKYADAKIGIFGRNIPIERYIPNIYRNELGRDTKRSSTPITVAPLVKPLDEITFGKGLSYRTLAIWPSHGAYMDFEDTTWKFQRPALFGTIEDIHTFYWLDNYLIPMLENSGAVIISPRERDTNPNEIILDNDSNDVKLTGNWDAISGGFKKIPIIIDENPFELGTSLVSSGLSTATYTTKIDSTAQYAVYVSYKRSDNNSKKALYTVFHSDGESKFEVNQTIGGGWVYLGKFEFVNEAKVVLSGSGQLSTDAVKIGGGMGNVSRQEKVSSMPRWAEAARYFMQYSGVPQSVYMQEHNNGKISDYMDDYKARGDWVNYLKINQKVPVDLAFALHTNAGSNDSIFGSLTINYTDKGRENYKNGTSKFAGRDFADILLSQVVGDIRALYDSTWVRRSMYDKSYAEVSRPDVPSVILELLSHQNYNDMVLAMNPKFRFDVSRAIYKGILKFLADRYGVKYEVQPLPVTNVRNTIAGDVMTLRWEPKIDSLEQSAKPTYYMVYVKNNGVWTKGVRVERISYDLPLPKTETEFKIVAYNEGGRSFDLETYSFNPKTPSDITVNHRKLVDYSVVGVQTDFDKMSQFVDNKKPGFGATDTSLLFKGVEGTF